VNICKPALRLAGAVLAAVTIAVAAQAPSLTIKFKNVAVPGALFTTATGINNSGMLVGYYVDSGGVTHGFMRSGKTVTTIDDPKGIATYCEGINSIGAIVGEYTQSNENNHGFLYQNGVFTDIGMGVISGADGINDQGVIVGAYLECGVCIQLGFIYDGGTYTTLSPTGADYTAAIGINNGGKIAVTVDDASGIFHAYIYNGKKYTNIDAPGYTDSYATAVNNLGDVSMIVDKVEGDNETVDGAILHQGQYIIFNYQNRPNILTRSYGINDHRESVGGFETRQAIGGFVALF